MRTREGQPLTTFGDNLDNVEFSLDSTLLLVTKYFNRKWILWTREGRKIKDFGENLGWVKFSPDSTLLVAKDNNGETVWTREGQPLTTFGENLGWVEFSPDSTLLVATADNGKGTLWTPKGHKLWSLATSSGM